MMGVGGAGARGAGASVGLGWLLSPRAFGVCPAPLELSVLGAVFLLSFLLRLCGESFPAASLVGAFAGRSSVLALGFLAGGFVCGAARGWLASRWPASWTLFLTRCAFSGVLFNVVGTLALAAMLDPQIEARVADVAASRGWVTVVYPDGVTLDVRPKPGGGYVISAPAERVPARVADAIWGIEDFRSDFRATGGIDVRALARAAFATFAGGKVEGASPVAETVGGLLFRIPRSGSLAERLSRKLYKFAVGLRVGDVYGRQRQAELLATLSTFGSLGGADVVGLGAASLVYYDKRPEQLSVAEAAELASRLASPRRFAPHRRPGEDAAAFEKRHALHRGRVEWAISRVEESGAISSAEAEAARAEVFMGLVGRDAAVARLRPPFLASIFRELTAAMLWPSARHLVVRVAATRGTQRALEEATAAALPEVERRAGPRAGDGVVFDALAADSGGAVLGRVGQWHAPSEQSSITKVPVLARALEDHVIGSLGQVVVDRRAADALITSHNETFVALTELMTPERAAETLRALGYGVNTAHGKVALGGGVTATLPTVLAMFGAFSYGPAPGAVVAPRVVAEVRDGETGERLYAPAPVRFVGEAVALEVRAALEGVARRGTAAREFGRLSAGAPVACKTGTSAYRDEDGRLRGRGGSWIAAADSQTGAVVVVCVRWQSGEPFDVNAGDSAALVARLFIQNIRGIQDRR